MSTTQTEVRVARRTNTSPRLVYAPHINTTQSRREVDPNPNPNSSARQIRTKSHLRSHSRVAAERRWAAWRGLPTAARWVDPGQTRRVHLTHVDSWNRSSQTTSPVSARSHHHADCQSCFTIVTNICKKTAKILFGTSRAVDIISIHSSYYIHGPWRAEKNFCCFLCVSYGPYTLLQNDSFFYIYFSNFDNYDCQPFIVDSTVDILNAFGRKRRQDCAYWEVDFYPLDAYASAVLAVIVCPSVCLSVCHKSEFY